MQALRRSAAALARRTPGTREDVHREMRALAYLHASASLMPTLSSPGARRRELAHVFANSVHQPLPTSQACSRLGDTGFNAYSINLDYRTGTHTDGKNWPGTMSALVILETGPPFCGGFYMLPQFHVAIAVRQGTVLFHRSGDPDVGCGASRHERRTSQSHRVCLSAPAE